MYNKEQVSGWIEIEDLLREVYNEGLKVYRDKGLVDDSLFYPIIEKYTRRFNTRLVNIKSAIIHVVNFKGELPSDLGAIRALFKGESYSVEYKNPSLQVEYEPVICKERPCEPPLISENGNKYYLNQKFDTYTIEFHNIMPLSVNKITQKNFCAPGFKNLSRERVSIQNGVLNAEFRTGTIYMEYESNETIGLIPDHPTLKEALKKICVHQGLQNVFLNGEADVLQRVQYMQSFAIAAENQLNALVKMRSVQEMVAFKSKMVAQYNLFDNMVKYSNYNG